MENSKEKSLQNLTSNDKKHAEVERLMQDDYPFVTQIDIERLSKEDKRLLVRLVSEKLKHGDRFGREEYLRSAEKYENVLELKSRNRRWDSNHSRIQKEIRYYLENWGRIPSMSELSSETDLSRQTISKHLEDFELGDYNKEQMQIFNILFNDLLVVLYQKGMDKDISAIKLYAEILEKRNVGNNTINIKNQQINVILEELATKISENIKK